jgi:hypothetical protein
MALLLFELDQLFILLVPELVVWFEAGAVIFPREAEFIENCLSINWNFVYCVSCTLRMGPHP